MSFQEIDAKEPQNCDENLINEILSSDQQLESSSESSDEEDEPNPILLSSDSEEEEDSDVEQEIENEEVIEEPSNIEYFWDDDLRLRIMKNGIESSGKDNILHLLELIKNEGTIDEALRQLDIRRQELEEREAIRASSKVESEEASKSCNDPVKEDKNTPKYPMDFTMNFSLENFS